MGVAGLPAETSTRPLSHLRAKKKTYCILLILLLSHFHELEFAPPGSDALALLSGISGLSAAIPGVRSQALSLIVLPKSRSSDR